MKAYKSISTIFYMFITNGFLMAIETPDYKIIKKKMNYEIREYEPMVIAKTVVEKPYKEATSIGFRRIANYIFGGNNKNMEISMTAPVVSINSTDKEHSVQILFVMPKIHTFLELPEPNLSSVEIERMDLGKVATIKFGGWATNDRIQIYINKLDIWLKNEKILKTGNFMVAQYNSPWALPPFRKNEIWIKIKD